MRYLVLSLCPKHRATRRTEARIFRRMNTNPQRLSENDRQWDILNECAQTQWFDEPAYYARHRRTKVEGYIAQSDVIRTADR